LWITRVLSVLLAAALCTASISACSTFKKKIQKPKEPKAVVVRAEKGLIGKNGDEVRKQLGEPTSVAKTPDDHILWIYVPSWKIMPDDRGTLYVEFENEKVAKAFRK
jgi:outer membrane protein assembly factor BamE (lipoprotein component of BamABCDE complex)